MFKKYASKNILFNMQVCIIDIQKTRTDGAEDGLVADDQNVLLAFQFHDDRFESEYEVLVGLAAAVPVMVLVLVAFGKVLRVAFLLVRMYCVNECRASSPIQ